MQNVAWKSVEPHEGGAPSRPAQDALALEHTDVVEEENRLADRDTEDADVIEVYDPPSKLDVVVVHSDGTARTRVLSR